MTSYFPINISCIYKYKITEENKNRIKKYDIIQIVNGTDGLSLFDFGERPSRVPGAGNDVVRETMARTYA